MRFSTVFLLILMLLISGCGGGGSSIGGGPPPTTTVISGVAAKGVILGGTVTFTKMVGSTPYDIGSTTTSATDGSYSKTIGDYTGVIIVKAYGTYNDESLPANDPNRRKTISSTQPLRAAVYVAQAGEQPKVSVTPLTEMAVRYAEARGGLNETSVKAANQLVSEVFSINILTATPRLPKSAVLIKEGVTEEDRKYTILLAGFAQESRSSYSGVNDMINKYSQEIINNARPTNTQLNSLVNTVDNFLANTAVNETGIQDRSTLLSIGKYPTTIVISASRKTLNAEGRANMVQFVVNLPVGYTVETTPDSGGVVADGVLQISQTSAVGIKSAKYDPNNNTVNVVLLSDTGMALGELATIRLMTDPQIDPSPSSIFTSTISDTSPYASKYVHDSTGTQVVDLSNVNWEISFRVKDLTLGQ